jgi:hypothetical protein
MPLPGIYASAISGNLFTLVGSYDSLATVTVPSGGVASVTFAGIPTEYKHLQFRTFAQCNRGTVGIDALKFTFNGISGTSYAQHTLRGDGANPVVAGGDINQAFAAVSRTVGTSAGGTFGSCIIDILDYANVNKYKTIRAIGGVDLNGTVGGIGGSIGLTSDLFMNTSAISSVTFTPDGGTLFNQYSSFALYGVK